MTTKVNIAIAGAAGRMGAALIQQAGESEAVRIAALLESSPSPTLTAASVPIINAADNVGAGLASASVNVLIDFTIPEATLSFLDACCDNNIGMVIGTTGFSDEQEQMIQNAAKTIPILKAQNMSVGVNAMYGIAAHAATTLGAGRLGGGYDMEVVEAHHRHKKDAPSGTALRLGEVLAAATGASLKDDGVFARHGANCERQENDIGFSTIRGGDIVGEHRVLFAGAGEQIEIIHRSTSRQHYAAGALRAALFVATAKPAFYDGMQSLQG